MTVIRPLSLGKGNESNVEWRIIKYKELLNLNNSQINDFIDNEIFSYPIRKSFKCFQQLVRLEGILKKIDKSTTRSASVNE